MRGPISLAPPTLLHSPLLPLVSPAPPPLSNAEPSLCVSRCRSIRRSGVAVAVLSHRVFRAVLIDVNLASVLSPPLCSPPRVVAPALVVSRCRRPHPSLLASASPPHCRRRRTHLDSRVVAAAPAPPSHRRCRLAVSTSSLSSPAPAARIAMSIRGVVARPPLFFRRRRRAAGSVRRCPARFVLWCRRLLIGRRCLSVGGVSVSLPQVDRLQLLVVCLRPPVVGRRSSFIVGQLSVSFAGRCVSLAGL